MTIRIGLAIAGDMVRAVGVRGGKIAWGVELPVDAGRPLPDALRELFATVRVRRWPRPVVVAAVGPGRAQLRRLSGLPPVANSSVLTRLVGESAGRFFLRNGVPLVTTGILRDSEDAGWGAALEQPVVETLEAACRASGFRLTAVLPSLAVLPCALEGDTLVWRDGDVSAELTLIDGTVCAVRRTFASSHSMAGEPDPAPPDAVAALTTLGPDGWRFADAFGAAVVSNENPLAYRPARSASDSPVPAWRISAAAVACGIALAAVLVAPVLTARNEAARATTVLTQLDTEARAAVAAEINLAVVTRALSELTSLARTRRSATLLLTDMTRALPQGSALVALRTDSTGGTLVALTPHAALLMGKLEGIRGLASPSIIGPITRESGGGAEVERVTLRFRWADGQAHPAASRHTP